MVAHFYQLAVLKHQDLGGDGGAGQTVRNEEGGLVLTELIELIELVQENQLPAIFSERSGSVSAAGIIAAETGVKTYTLDMAMAGDSYFEAMHNNIHVLKEALG